MARRPHFASLVLALAVTTAGYAATPCMCDDGPPPDTVAILAAVKGVGPTTRPTTRPLAAEALREARSAADASTGWQHDDLLGLLVDGELDAGDVDAAVDLAGQQHRSPPSDGAVDHVDAFLAGGGHLDRAFAFGRARHRLGRFTVDRDLMWFAVGRARDGDVADSVRATDWIATLTVRSDALMRVARVATRRSARPATVRGLRDAAWACAAASNAAEPLDQAYALTNLARTWFAIGDAAVGRDTLQRAAAVANGFSDEYADDNRRSALARIAVAAADGGDATTAMRLLELVRRSERRWGDPADREAALRDIASIEVRNGRLADALDLATRVTQFTQYRDDALLDLAAELARRGRTTEAVAVCGRMGDVSRRSQAVLTVAIAEARRGDLGAAARTAAAATVHQSTETDWVTKVFGQFSEDDPSTWTVPFRPNSSTLASFQRAKQERADLAGVAARLAVLLGRSPRLGPDQRGAVAEAYLAAADTDSI